MTREVDDIDLLIGDDTAKATFRVRHTDGSLSLFELERERAEAMVDMIEDSYRRYDELDDTESDR